ncbi:adenylate/guanylate cyclase domain-containing protein [Novipirellula artificiosorum]|uniref:Adenylate and Guanylate cyclase catalytic domain protein n=1 Tax=Novipirellula artificiosorum TaxID=2528016 RepID=A0A5C6D5B0_9BACT|nr:adenylate/guanylate cyclase domain-containing protein [Novipirellula artificiosorum]TWU31215.1 Adenylate and Guanylate cyclase catalytic domain protein [Novipirellula artificiosorum]
MLGKRLRLHSIRESTVNVASRLCSVAASGTIVVSSSVAAALEASEFRLVPQSLLRVKGVDADLKTYLLDPQSLAMATG